jgi:putative membrane protein
MDSGTRAWLRAYLTGLAMGTADAIPGVSGGTIALIAGVYERLIAALTALDRGVVLTILQTPRPGHRAAGIAAFRRADISFLVVLGVGVGTAIVTLAQVMEAAIEHYPAPTFAFFFGLILASAVLLYRRITIQGARQVGAGVAGFAVAFLLSGAAGPPLGTGLAATAVAGAVAISAMVLPGISGSLLLLILGQYERMIGVLKAFQDGLFGLLAGGDMAAVIEPGVTIAAFCTGALVGLFTVAHAVRAALDRAHDLTMVFLVSLVVGGLRAPVERVLDATTVTTPDTAAVLVAAAVLGAVVVLGLERLAGGVADIDATAV